MGKINNGNQWQASTASARIGIGCTALIGATLFFSLQDAETKILLQDYSIWQLVLIRFFSLMVVLLGISVFQNGGPLRVIRSGRPWLQCVRGAFLIAEIALIGLSFKYLGLAEAMTVFHVFPIVGVIFAIVLLGERAAWQTAVALIAGFLGVVIVAGPGTDINPMGLLLSLSAAVCYAIYLVLTRMTSFVDGVMTSLLFASLAGSVIPLFLGWNSFQPIDGAHAWNFVRLCLFNMIGQTCIVLAFSSAPATVLQPLNYVQIVWAAVIGYLVFGDTPASSTWIGGALIVAAGILQIRASQQQARTVRC